MEITSYIKKIPSSDGKHELYGRVYLPEGEVKGLFHVVHGMTEHMERYEPFMKEMAKEGFICFGYDHLGHGKTVKDASELGYIAKKDGQKRLVEDVTVFGNAMRKDFGEKLPYILMGHSMGSFIVRLASVDGRTPDKLIVMGTGGPNPVVGAGILLVAAMKLFGKGKTVSKFLCQMAFGSYNKKFEGDGKRGWLTTDAAVREKYDNDPLCNFHFTVSAMGDLITLTKRANDKNWFEALPKDLPVLLVAGVDDPVGNYGKGVKVVFKKLKKQGCHVEIKLYKGRHEILNDTCKEAVIEDIKNFSK